MWSYLKKDFTRRVFSLMKQSHHWQLLLVYQEIASPKNGLHIVSEWGMTSKIRDLT